MLHVSAINISLFNFAERFVRRLAKGGQSSHWPDALFCKREPNPTGIVFFCTNVVYSHSYFSNEKEQAPFL
jgi:hypothetical protein